MMPSMLLTLKPGSCFTFCFFGLTSDIITRSSFFIQVLFQSIKLMFQILEFSNQKLTLTGFSVSNVLGIIQCSNKRLLHLGNHVNIVGEITNNSEKIGILSCKTPLTRLKISKGHVG